MPISVRVFLCVASCVCVTERERLCVMRGGTKQSNMLLFLIEDESEREMEFLPTPLNDLIKYTAFLKLIALNNV